MASVQELKDALATEQDKAAQLAERSFQAIDSITNLANFWLTLLSVQLAIIGLVGVVVIYVGAKNSAKRVAEGRINSYITGKEGMKLVRESVEEEVRSQFQNKSFVIALPDQGSDNEDAFKPAPKPKGAKG